MIFHHLMPAFFDKCSSLELDILKTAARGMGLKTLSIIQNKVTTCCEGSFFLITDIILAFTIAPTQDKMTVI